MTDYVPIVLTGQALRSLRDSGYSLSAAIAEVVDNSLEANANEIRIRLDEESGRDKRRRIHRISVSDDGDGMDSDLLQLYPQIGFSTRYLSTTTIGKYGVGAKLAALNYGERLDVWSRASAEQPCYTFTSILRRLRQLRKMERNLASRHPLSILFRMTSLANCQRRQAHLSFGPRLIGLKRAAMHKTRTCFGSKSRRSCQESFGIS